MCDNKKVNGWSNYPTWNWALHNDGNYWSEIAQEIYDDAEPEKYFTREDVAIIELTDKLDQECKESYEENFGNLTGSFSDIFEWAIEQIDFREIAENFMANVVKDTEEKEDIDE